MAILSFVFSIKIHISSCNDLNLREVLAWWRRWGVTTASWVKLKSSVWVCSGQLWGSERLRVKPSVSKEMRVISWDFIQLIASAFKELPKVGISYRENFHKKSTIRGGGWLAMDCDDVHARPHREIRLLRIKVHQSSSRTSYARLSLNHIRADPDQSYKRGKKKECKERDPAL